MFTVWSLVIYENPLYSAGGEKVYSVCRTDIKLALKMHSSVH